MRGKIPYLHGLTDLTLPAFPLVEKANSGIRSVTIGPAQQLRQRCKRPRGHDVGLGGLDSFDPADDDSGRSHQFHAPGRFAKKRGFACICFDQGDFQVGSQGGNDQARKPCASAEIGKLFGALGD